MIYFALIGYDSWL